jgi:hypothetical protein
LYSEKMQVTLNQTQIFGIYTWQTFEHTNVSNFEIILECIRYISWNF